MEKGVEKARWAGDFIGKVQRIELERLQSKYEAIKKEQERRCLEVLLKVMNCFSFNVLRQI